MSDEKDTIVIDLDGTLADIGHRLDFIRRPRPDYPSFFGAVAGDAPNAWCRELIHAFRGRKRIVLVSGRPAGTRADTEAWLARHDIPYDELHLVRGDRDHRPDDELKRDWLTRYGKHRVLFTIDDRQRVVDMWRDEGLVCLQCDAWTEFRAPRARHDAPPKRLGEAT